MESFRPRVGSETLSGKEGGMKQGRGGKEGAVREERKGGKRRKAGQREEGGPHQTEMGSHCCSCTQPDSAFSNFISISILN